MTPLCSIGIPTRKRPHRILGAISAAFQSVEDRSRIEVVVRVHSDDQPTLAAVPQMKALGAKVIVGKPYLTYPDHVKVCDEIADAEQGYWSFGVCDDGVITGAKWDAFLAKQPKEGVYFAPEVYINGGSSYFYPFRSPVLILPNKIWQKFGHPTLPFPQDVMLPEMLKNEGWEERVIPGLIWHHFFDPHVG